VAASNKRYRENNREKISEANKRYRKNNREKIRDVKKRYRENNREKLLEAKKRYQETHREQLRASRRRYHVKKRTAEKLKALGPLKRTVTLTDYLKSPCVDTPVVSYLDTFCQTLAVEKDPYTSAAASYVESLCQTLQPERNSLTLMDLDSGDIRPLDQPAWDQEVDQWLDDLMDVIEDMSPRRPW